MKKVLIADDEFLVRVGLKTTINWEENGFIVIGEAKNGKEAIDFFEKFDPDILLTDIRMPIIDGLELIQKLKEKKKTLKAVILSHYDDFVYAQEAIKIGASQYILKSDLSSDNLLAILKKLSDEIDTIQEKTNTPYNQSDIQNMNNDQYNRMLMKRFITGDFESTDELAGILEEASKTFKHHSFAIAVASIKYKDNTHYEKDKELFAKTINNISSQVFDGRDFFQISFVEDKRITYLLNMEIQDNVRENQEKIIHLMMLLEKNIKQFLDIKLTIGISEIGSEVDKLPQLLKQAEIAQKHCFFELSEIMIYQQGMLIKKESSPKVSLEVLKSYVRLFDIEKIEKYINAIFTQLYAAKRIDYVKDVFIDLLSYGKIIAIELNLMNQSSLNETKFRYGNFEQLHTFEAVKKYVLDIYHALVNYKGDHEKYSYVISKSIEYIKNNYFKNIALSDVAEYVEMSRSYLSLLFKQETGINFSNFLTNYRIEKSKELLTGSNLKVYEIAEKVGFDNPYYFSRVFKETIGITCKEFKKNINVSERSCHL
ncbi:response regulator [Petroclostridium sp. X23]|uniref:response regulator transcription factor n=1 Tax=Petroclostridium sp. X23 TaxID=3045146 RepID=UPI0024ACB9E8|nr:response regulator [Petroclostridium sp. X23]WHH61122.1 response regulator [Petroclostridium sp. X23]